MNAQLIGERTGIETLLRERAATSEAGTIRANAGASGLAFGGSAADVLRMSARNAAFDIASIQKQGELEKKVTLLGGQAAKAAGNLGAISALTGTASDILLRRG